MLLLKKYIWCLLLLMATLGLLSHCKNNTTVAADKEMVVLKKYFPNATEINIDTLENGIQYNFLNGDEQCEVFFDSASNYKFAATYIEPENLPDAIKNTLKKNYNFESVTVAKQIKSPDKTTYTVEMQMPTDFYSLDCSEDGKILKIYKSQLSPTESAAQEEEGVEND